MRVSAPLWLNAPIVTWIPCQVVGELQPQGYIVEVSIEGAERSIVVPKDYIQNLSSSTTFPSTAELRVLVIAEIPDDDRMLAELPSTPLNGSQRVLGSPAALKVA